MSEHLKRLYLWNMPSYKLDQVYPDLPPSLEVFHLKNLDKFTLANFKEASKALLKCVNLQYLGLELLSFSAKERDFVDEIVD